MMCVICLVCLNVCLINWNGVKSENLCLCVKGSISSSSKSGLNGGNLAGTVSKYIWDKTNKRNWFEV